MGDIVWTKHALERNKERQLTHDWVEQTINNPDTFDELSDGKLKLRKKFGKQTVNVISARADNGGYLVLSAWINPPIFGTAEQKRDSYKKQMRKAGALRKFWLTLRHQIGL